MKRRRFDLFVNVALMPLPRLAQVPDGTAGMHYQASSQSQHKLHLHGCILRVTVKPLGASIVGLLNTMWKSNRASG